MAAVSPYRLAFVGFALLHFSGSALADLEESSERAPTALPTVYFDLRLNYATVPANSLAVGFSSPSLATAIATLQSLSLLHTSAAPRTLSAPSSRNVSVDVPLTIDISDRISLYGGITAVTSQSGMSEWSSLAVSSWSVGFQAVVYQQNGGSMPSITLQSTVSGSVPDSPLATTSLNNIVEFSYSLNEKESEGLLAGVQYTSVKVDSPLAQINSNTIGYFGGYYQWPDNWKFTGRVGVQSFGGAQLLNIATIQPFTQPIVRLDLDRMDSSDNRLFGMTAQISWVPKPAYQLTIRTPLYALKN